MSKQKDNNPEEHGAAQVPVAIDRAYTAVFLIRKGTTLEDLQDAINRESGESMQALTPEGVALEGEGKMWVYAKSKSASLPSAFKLYESILDDFQEDQASNKHLDTLSVLEVDGNLLVLCNGSSRWTALKLPIEKSFGDVVVSNGCGADNILRARNHLEGNPGITYDIARTKPGPITEVLPYTEIVGNKMTGESDDVDGLKLQDTVGVSYNIKVPITSHRASEVRKLMGWWNAGLKTDIDLIIRGVEIEADQADQVYCDQELHQAILSRSPDVGVDWTNLMTSDQTELFTIKGGKRSKKADLLITPSRLSAIYREWNSGTTLDRSIRIKSTGEGEGGWRTLADLFTFRVISNDGLKEFSYHEGSWKTIAKQTMDVYRQTISMCIQDSEDFLSQVEIPDCDKSTQDEDTWLKEINDANPASSVVMHRTMFKSFGSKHEAGDLVLKKGEVGCILQAKVGSDTEDLVYNCTQIQDAANVIFHPEDRFKITSYIKNKSGIDVNLLGGAAGILIAYPGGKSEFLKAGFRVMKAVFYMIVEMEKLAFKPLVIVKDQSQSDTQQVA